MEAVFQGEIMATPDESRMIDKLICPECKSKTIVQGVIPENYCCSKSTCRRVYKKIGNGWWADLEAVKKEIKKKESKPSSWGKSYGFKGWPSNIPVRK